MFSDGDIQVLLQYAVFGRSVCPVCAHSEINTTCLQDAICTSMVGAV